jgi:Flp pilus assembly pilin Flp
VEKLRDQSGQAVVEYVVLLTIILGMAATLQYGVQKTRDKLWKFVICKVSAPCPSCGATDSAKAVLPKGGSCPD